MVFTAERVHESSPNDAPVYFRQLFAYLEVKKLINGDVLEVGCGDAYGTKLLVPLAKTYTAVDKFKSENIAKQEGVNFIQMNVPPFEGLKDNSFDTIISFQVIEHIQDDKYFLKELQRLLKPGGKFIFTTPNKKMSLTRNPYHIREYVMSEYKELCSVFSNFELKGVFGDEKVMEYFEKNRESVKKITRFDIFNLQYKLPRRVLQIPYDLANALNRKRLAEENTALTQGITTDNYYLDNASDVCLDFFCIAEK